VFNESDPPTPDGIGLLENIHISGLHVHKTSETSTTALIDLQERLKDFSVSDVHREIFEDANPDAPTLRIRNVRITDGHLDGEVFRNISLLGMLDVLERNLLGVRALSLHTSCEERLTALS
jgi:hypothetical protein